MTLRRPTNSQKPATWCKEATNAVKKLPSNATRNEHEKRVDMSVLGATTGALLLLGGGVYIRVKTGGRRPRSTVMWLIVFVLVLIAVLVNNRIRDHPQDRELRNVFRGCKKFKSNHVYRECANECALAENALRSIHTTSTMSRILYIATPLIFVFAAIAFFSVYRTTGNAGSPMSTRRRRSLSDMEFIHPTPIAVFSVALPSRAERVTPNFSLRTVHEDDDEEGKTDPQCAICLNDIWSRPVGELSCGHRFHNHCVSDWLRKAPRPTCPLCKAIVGDEDDDGRADSVV